MTLVLQTNLLVRLSAEKLLLRSKVLWVPVLGHRAPFGVYGHPIENPFCSTILQFHFLFVFESIEIFYHKTIPSLN